MSVAAPTIGNQTAEPVAKLHADHLGGVDWLRIIGIAAVAYYHAYKIWYPDAPLGPVSFAGLHALTAAAAYFAAASKSTLTDGQILSRRFHRLLIPWLFFSLPFTLKAIHSGKFQWWMLWMGGSQHLWFLPFIFVVGCAIAMARRRQLIVSSPASGIAWTIAALVTLIVEPRLGPRVPDIGGLWQWTNALPAVVVGIAIYAIPRSAIFAIAQLALFAGAAVVAQTLAPLDAMSWPPAVAVGSLAFGIAKLLPIPANAASQFFGRTSFGVYLVHMIALDIVRVALVKATHSPGPAVASDSLGLIILAQVALAIVGSIIAVAILEKTPLRRFIA